MFLADCAEFERWVDSTRGRFARMYSASLEALAERAEGAGDAVQATDWWRLLAAHDPYNSRTALRLVQALDASGARAAALQHAREHGELLRSEFGTEPSAALVTYVERMRSATVVAVPPEIGR